MRRARSLTHSGALAVGLGVLALSCGGRAAATGFVSDEESGDDGSPATSVGGSNTGAGSSGSAGRPTRRLDFPEMVLPACEPGFRSRGPGERRCNYTFEGLCYEDEAAACACACPGAICVISGSQTVGDAPIGILCQARPR